ncbi:SDR family oxidoreductase [Streptomyces sp. TRM72054]|uniref:SDR family NAD(P)-dependent oxidoreductase n=1 Tax=Streptomyces sp. TRM72054 TaxID=2870562 RepID=UPI0027E0843E|nr:SDR family oxidoreductase [Streptomyces sp. TRM72054]
MALISGTARGQGRAAALRFAAEGAIVVGGDLRHESELKARRLVAQAGGTAVAPGCIVTVGSTAGLTGSLTNQRTALPQLSASLEPGGAPMASKGAVIAMTRQLAAEGAPYGIRANCVSPGVIDTEATRGDLPADDHPKRINARHIPLGRIRLPEEAVNAAVFLASDEASYITGADLVVDGGRSSVLPS